MLTTWEEIKAALARYPLRSQQPELLTFGWPEAGQTTEIIQVKYAEIQERNRIFIGVNVMADSKAIAHEALVINSEIFIGALAAFHGNLVLRHAMTVGSFDEVELHEVLASMARSAARIHGRLDKTASSPITGYAD